MAMQPKSFRVLCVLLFINVNGNFYSCPIVTTHSSNVNKSIINTNSHTCLSIDCSYFSAIHRSGYICNTWPLYTGLLLPQWTKSSNTYQCTNKNNDSIWCNQWITTDFNLNCYCIHNNNKHCLQSFCIDLSGSDSDKYSNISIDICGVTQFNSSIYCPHIPSSSLSFNNCWCKLQSHTHNFCQRWYCEYYDNNINLNVIQTEWKKCISLMNENQNYSDSLCWKWIGDIVNNDAWSVNECVCNTPSSIIIDGNAFCVSWECSSIGMEYFIESSDSIGLFWIWFVLFNIIGSFIIFGSCGYITYYGFNKKYISSSCNKCKLFLITLSVVLLPILCLIIGGFINFIFLMISSIISFICGYYCLHKIKCLNLNNMNNINKDDGDEISKKTCETEKETRNILSYCEVDGSDVSGQDDLLQDIDDPIDNIINSNNQNQRNVWIEPDGFPQSDDDIDDKPVTTPSIVTITTMTSQ